LNDLGGPEVDALFQNLSAGNNVNIGRTTNIESMYVNVTPSGLLAIRGPQAYRDYINQPGGEWDSTLRPQETVDSLRTKLLQGADRLREPMEMTVEGTLYPSALLTSGWWNKQSAACLRRIKWRDGIQEWLFRGFEEWAPSWDFTWNWKEREAGAQTLYVVAQLADGDEANSIPVLLPISCAKWISERFDEWGGVQARVTGLLGHRTHFNSGLDETALEFFGGLLNYCLWLDAGNKRHCVQPLAFEPQLYSGYLWKCVAPRSLLLKGTPKVNDVYFVWEHANLADADATAYALELLEHKVEYVQRRWPGDPLVLIQKSAELVPGVPEWSQRDVYALLTGKKGSDSSH
jgi:hypothetical protein